MTMGKRLDVEMRIKETPAGFRRITAAMAPVADIEINTVADHLAVALIGTVAQQLISFSLKENPEDGEKMRRALIRMIEAAEPRDREDVNEREIEYNSKKEENEGK